MAAIALSITRKPEKPPTPLRRVECTCGWRGPWYASAESLQASIVIHLRHHEEHGAE